MTRRTYKQRPEVKERYRGRDKRHRRELLPRHMERQGGKCGLCNHPLPKDKSLIHLDRIIPGALGGEYTYQNTQLACASCNISKGAKAIPQNLVLI